MNAPVPKPNLANAAPVSERTIQTERHRLRAELETLNTHAEREFPNKRKAVDVAAAAVRDAEQKLAAAQADLRTALHAKYAASNQYSSARAEIEASLAASASPEIEAFIAWAREQIRVSRNRFGYSSRNDRSPVTREVRVVVDSNSLEINERVAALSAAIEAAEEMRLLADQSGVPTEIQKLTDRIPPLS